MGSKTFQIFVSGKVDKLQEFQMLTVDEIPWNKLSLPEIQSFDLKEIAENKVLAAYDIVKSPVWVEDTGLFISEWDSLPGPFIKWFLELMGNEAICQVLSQAKDRTAIARTVIAYYDGVKVRIFLGEVIGNIVPSPRGENGFGWESIFEPQGSNLTFGEMSKYQKNEVSMRAKAFHQFIEYIKSRKDI